MRKYNRIVIVFNLDRTINVLSMPIDLRSNIYTGLSLSLYSKLYWGVMKNSVLFMG
jgi:hypothetical protein